MDLVKKAKLAYVIVSVVMLVLGLAMFVHPQISATVICYITGIILLGFAVVKLIGFFSADLFKLAFQFDLALGIISGIAGLFLITRPDRAMELLPIVTGVLLIIDGAFKLQSAVDARRFGMTYWWLILLLAICTAVCGLILFTDPFDGALAVMMAIGAAFAIEGSENLWIVIYTVKTEKEGRDRNAENRR